MHSALLQTGNEEQDQNRHAVFRAQDDDQQSHPVPSLYVSESI